MCVDDYSQERGEKNRETRDPVVIEIYIEIDGIQRREPVVFVSMGRYLVNNEILIWSLRQYQDRLSSTM